MSDNELGAFLRSRREAVSPADVGLPAGSRRRTPGLRRAELATLAGVSVEYLTRLEQGRDRHPSAQVLGALSDALLLTTDERMGLLRLSKASGGGHPLCPMSQPPARSIRPTVRTLLDRLEPTPAVLLNRLSDVLAWTSGYERLTGPIGLLDDEFANLARFVFTDPRARDAFLDWERLADELITDLKIGSNDADPHLTALTQEITVIAGAAFSARWESAAVLTRGTAVERVAHPDAGELRLARESLELPDSDDQRLLVYLPADEATSGALDRLAGRHPGALRAVSG